MILESPGQWVDFLCKHKMSPTQFLFLYIIYENDYPALYKYVQENGGFDMSELNDLEERGYMINDNPNLASSLADCYTVTDKFIKELYNTDVNTAYEEFFEAYPVQIYVDGRRLPGRNATLKTRTYYKKKIATKRALHKKVMECLEYAKRNNLVTMGMEKWIETEQYRSILELMKTNIDEFESPNDKLY
jgi:hypothetical protein